MTYSTLLHLWPVLNRQPLPTQYYCCSTDNLISNPHGVQPRRTVYCNVQSLDARIYQVFVKASLRDPSSDNKVLAEGDGLFYMRKTPASAATRTTAHAGLRRHDEGGHDVSASRPPAMPSDVLSYDEAIRQFGSGSPDAVTKIVEFYGGDVAGLRAKL